jgi:hypothetical protein
MPDMAASIGNFTVHVNGQPTVSRETLRQSYYRRMDSLKIIVGRIERRLKAVGKTAAGASKEAGLSSSAIYNLQRGAKGKIATKGGNASTFAALAPILETTPTWLMTGEGPESADSTNPNGAVRLVGYVGAGAETHFYAVSQGDFDEVPAPEGATGDTRAVEIRGSSLGSMFDRWLVFYDDVRRPVTPDLIGRLCVVGLPDDRVLIKQICASKRRGRYRLLSEREPPIEDAQIEWAARVKHMVPR